MNITYIYMMISRVCYQKNIYKWNILTTSKTFMQAMGDLLYINSNTNQNILEREWEKIVGRGWRESEKKGGGDDLYL